MQFLITRWSQNHLACHKIKEVKRFPLPLPGKESGSLVGSQVAISNYLSWWPHFWTALKLMARGRKYHYLIKYLPDQIIVTTSVPTEDLRKRRLRPVRHWPQELYVRGGFLKTNSGPPTLVLIRPMIPIRTAPPASAQAPLCCHVARDIPRRHSSDYTLSPYLPVSILSLCG